MPDIYNDICNILSKRPEILYGISDTEFSKYRTDYKSAVVFAVPYSEMVELNNYNEERFRELLTEARRQTALSDEIISVLKEFNIKYIIPPFSQSSEETLLVTFSYKYAAVRAGLGWIGKNGVLVTEKYGPRVTLAVLLVDYDLPLNKPIETSGCPIECRLCIDACPHSALRGIMWDMTKKREEIIDYRLCNRKRSELISVTGRKNSCGLCIAACTIGL